MARHALQTYGPIELVDLDNLDPEALVVPVAFVGSPTVIQEKIPNGSEGLVVKKEFERILKRPVAALMSAELGGINGVIPVAWCAIAGLPMVDADLIGRAFPQIHMTIPHLFGHPISPVVTTDERGNVVSFRTVTNEWAERLVRSTTVAMGAMSAIGAYPMTVAQAKRFTVLGSVSRSIEVGKALLQGRRDDPLKVLREQAGALPLVRGKIIDVNRRTVDGWAQGSIIVEGTDGDTGRMLRVEFQNENLVALLDGECVATVPDIITVVDIHTGWPVVTEVLHFGQRVAVVALPCDPVWRSEKGLSTVGPRAFGYEIDYTPLDGRS